MENNDWITVTRKKKIKKYIPPPMRNNIQQGIAKKLHLTLVTS